MSDRILVFDIGTTALKCAVFDSLGTERKSVSVPYACSYPRPGWAEQDAEDFWKAALRACSDLFAGDGREASGIAAVGLSGHMNGCLAVGADGEALRPQIIHSDSRSSAECADILKALSPDEAYDLTGNRVDEHLSLPKMLWIRKHEPEVYSRTAYFLNSKDYLRFRLTGVAGMTDYSDASLTCAMDLWGKRWADSLLKEVGLDPSKFPRLGGSAEACGGITVEASRALGLPSGLPVVLGGGDAACATRGAGICGNRNAYANIGSSAWISTLAAGPIIDPLRRMQNFYDLDGESCNVCGTVQCAGIAADWALGLLSESPAAMDARVETVPPGADGILFAPYLMGERTPHWDSEARGAFVGLSLFHGKAALARSVYEGVSYALKDVFSVYPELGFSISELTLLGGGAKSRVWRRIVGDVLGVPVRAHSSPTNATSLGAAMAAGVGVGLFPDFDTASRVAGSQPAEAPDPEATAVYERLYPIYRELYGRLKPIDLALAKEFRAAEST